MFRQCSVSKDLIQLSGTLVLYPIVFLKKRQRLVGAAQIHLHLVKLLMVCFNQATNK